MSNYCTVHKKSSTVCARTNLRNECMLVAKKPSTKKVIKEPAPKKIKTTCEKRLPSGNYCKKQREFRVSGNSLVKIVCGTHLSDVVKFVGGHPAHVYVL